jgi:hypothetical protein
MEIPTYRKQQGIPGTTGQLHISPDKVAEPYQAEAQARMAEANLHMAEAKVGEAVSKTSFDMLTILKRLERQKEDSELIEVGSKINDDALMWGIEFEKNNKGKNASGSMQKVSEFTKQLQDKYGQGGSPRYKTLVNQHIFS